MVTHEALLWHWPRVKEWIEQNRENLRVHSRINAAAERWIRENRSPDLLLPTGKPLEEGKGLLESKSTLTSYESAFIQASVAAARRRQHIRYGMVTALGFFALLASVAALFANQQRELADAERARAEIEAVTAQRTTDFVVGLFEVSDPSEARGQEITAAEILAAGAARIERELGDEPEIRARLQETMGKVYVSLGALSDAEPMLTKSLETRRGLPSAQEADIASSLHHLGHALALRAKLDEAEKMLVDAIEIRRRQYGGSHPAVADSLHWLAYVRGQKGDFAAAEPLLMEAIDIRRATLGQVNLEVASSLQELGMNHFDQGDYEQAEALLRESLAMRRQLLGAEPHPAVATALNNLALVMHTRGDSVQAEALSREALAMKRALLPEANNEIAISINNIAVLLRRRGELGAAMEMYQEALEIQQRVLGPTHPEVASTMFNLASLLNAMDRNEEAIELANRALAIRQQQHAGDHPQTAHLLMSLGQWLSESGQVREADEKLQQALTMRERILPGDHPDLSMSRMMLANHLVETGRPEEGCPLGANSVAVLSAAYGDTHWRVAVARGLEGACLHVDGRREDSEALLLASLAGLDSDGANNAARRQTLRRLVKLYEDWNKPAEAARYRQQLATSEKS